MSCVAQYDASIILSHDILHQCLSSNNKWWPSYRNLFCYMRCKNTLTNPNTSRKWIWFARLTWFQVQIFNMTLCGSIYHVFRRCGCLILVQPNLSSIWKNSLLWLFWPTRSFSIFWLPPVATLICWISVGPRMHMYISFQVEWWSYFSLWARLLKYCLS